MRFSSVFSYGAKNPAGFAKFIGLLPKFIRLFIRLFFDSRVPFFSKLIFIGAMIYTISPLDFIPEMIFPIIGFADDIGLIILSAKKLLSDTPPEVLKEHVAKIEGRKFEDIQA